MAETDAMPGMADSSPSTTLRMVGTTESNRNTRSMRSARSAANASLAGINAIPTTTKSNTLHGRVKNFKR